MPALSIEDALISREIISREELKNLLNERKKAESSWHRLLLESKAVDEQALLDFWASELELEILSSIQEQSLDPDLVRSLPIHLLKKEAVLPLTAEDGRLRIAVADPFNHNAMENIRALLDLEDLQAVLAPKDEILSAVNRVFGQAESDAGEFLQKLDWENGGAFMSELEESSEEDLLDERSEAPIIKLVNRILTQAVHSRASDIHVEPYRNELIVRYRLDGVLYNIFQLPYKVHPALISRLKILSGLNIAEKRAPQDGRIQIRIGDRNVDLRVSTLPTAFGERMVLRILEKDQKLLNLREIGLGPKHLRALQGFIHQSNGIILVTGPTGSGKTTTLYSALREINTPDKNILTIEDPVEYQLDGIGQMQVNPKIGLTFAKGLRSMVRQDPDVILVGEIRDLETAEIAIQAALTGHLVFSTLHTNDAAGAITRLIDMGIEPFLASSSLRAILAQRLVRTLCSKCKEPYSPSEAELQELGISKVTRSLTLHRAMGCEACMNTGFRGRTGIFEMLPISEAIQTLMLKSSESNQIRQAAVREGMRTLRRDGVAKIVKGQTTIDEVLRVTQA